MASPDDTIHNEQVKLATAALNNIGVAWIVTSVIVPMIEHASSSAVSITSRSPRGLRRKLADLSEDLSGPTVNLSLIGNDIASWRDRSPCRAG